MTDEPTDRRKDTVRVGSCISNNLFLLCLGSPRRIAYKFNNTDADGYSPDMCYVDWPNGNLMKPCIYKTCPDQEVEYQSFTQTLSWDIRNCENVTEGLYTVDLGAWNPLDGWVWLEKPFQVEVLERIGPIFIDDYNIISDYNETKEFNIRFAKMGWKTCVTIDWGDGSKLKFYGNALSCKQRYQHITEDDVKSIDYVGKQFFEVHVYMVRNLYRMTVTGFDERSYAEESLDLTIFSMPCKVPSVWLPVNETSWLRPERIPIVFRSKSYQVASMSVLECNRTVVPSMDWSIFGVTIKKDPNSQTGLIEELTEVRINDTIPTYQSAMIDIPPNILDYGLYKLVFKLEIDTGVPGLPLFKKAYTYFNISKSPLVPGFIKGSVSKVTRGWGQTVELDAKMYSIDPDFPEDKEFNYTWFCRRFEPDPEDWIDMFELDSDYDGVAEEFPLFIPSQAQRVPKPGDPVIVLPPPGCFGSGPGGISHSAAKLTLNTSSLVTYAQVYEVTMIVSKDNRIAQTNIKVDVGVIPAPVIEIGCASEGLCTPTFGGIFVNPTSRLAMRSNCLEQCDGGTITYSWNIKLDPARYPFRLNVVTCDPDLTTTSTTTTTTTTTTVTTTTTLPPLKRMSSASFTDDVTNIDYYATETPEGVILVTYQTEDAGGKRRKRNSLAISIGDGDTEEEQEIFTGKQVLIPENIAVGCSSVFTAGIDQNEFSMTTDFFKMNPLVKDFEMELNITRCINNGRKTSCSSGVSTLVIKINNPPWKGECVIKNIGVTEEMDPSNPGVNTALLGK